MIIAHPIASAIEGLYKTEEEAVEGPSLRQRVSAAGGGPGLSYITYLTARSKTRSGVSIPPFEVTAYDGGSLLKFKPLEAKSARKRPGGGRRGRIEGFSKASRLRLQQTFSKLNSDYMVAGYVATLTYPGQFPSPHETKRHLDVFLKRLKRKFPGVAGIWKIEPQKRGAPHYHLFLVGLAYIGRHREWVARVRSWLSQAWYEVVGSGDEKHLRAGTEFGPVRNKNHALAYIGKYLSKEADFEGGAAPGRIWATFGPIEQYMGEEVVFAVPGGVAVKMFRLLDQVRVVAARRAVRGRYTETKRRYSIRRARKRRGDFLSRWYVCDVGQLMRYFLDDVGELLWVPS